MVSNEYFTVSEKTQELLNIYKMLVATRDKLTNWCEAEMTDENPTDWFFLAISSLSWREAIANSLRETENFVINLAEDRVKNALKTDESQI